MPRVCFCRPQFEKSGRGKRELHNLLPPPLPLAMKFRDKQMLVLLVLLQPLRASRPTGATESPLTESARRRIRALSYPEESQLGLFFALAMPLDDPASAKAVNVAFFFEANYKLPQTAAATDDEEEEEEESEQPAKETRRRRRRRAIDRSTLYRALESKFESLGFPGRQCLLRAICETAKELRPEHRHNGLVGDLMRITFTPSSSESEEATADYPEYALAEEHGAAAAAAADSLGDCDCAAIYGSCPFSIYQHITE